jgi:hypothetical protein
MRLALGQARKLSRYQKGKPDQSENGKQEYPTYGLTNPKRATRFHFSPDALRALMVYTIE